MKQRKGAAWIATIRAQAVAAVNKGGNFVHIHLFSLINAWCRFFRCTFRGAEILWAHKHSLLQLLCFYLVVGWMSALFFKTMTSRLTRLDEIEGSSKEYLNTFAYPGCQFLCSQSDLPITWFLFCNSTLFSLKENTVCHLNKYMYRIMRYRKLYQIILSDNKI